MSRIIINIEDYEQIISVDGVVINNAVFQDELVNYNYRDRKDFIDDLFDWIGEAKGNDRELMKEDFFYLSKLDDKYMFSSILTNEYIVLSEDEKEFNEICDEILEANSKIV